MGRSGSTLLRFVLDAHPELACPPETSLPALCGQLAVVWSLIEGAPWSEVRGDTPPEVPDPAVAGIRHVADLMTGSYLERRGKRRFLDHHVEVRADDGTGLTRASYAMTEQVRAVSDQRAGPGTAARPCMSAANWSKVRLWSASDRAWSGSGWTSMSRPWAPAARAAQAIGAT